MIAALLLQVVTWCTPSTTITSTTGAMTYYALQVPTWRPWTGDLSAVNGLLFRKRMLLRGET